MFKKFSIVFGIFIILSFLNVSLSYSQNERDLQLTTIEGKITDIFVPYAIVQTKDGREYEVFLGPPWFLMDRDICLRIGDKIKVSGELEEFRDIKTLYPHALNIGEEKITFVDKEGIPMWAYRGYSGRAPRRYMNRNIPDDYRADRGYYRYYGRNRMYGRGMFWRRGWDKQGGYWMLGRGWHRNWCPYRGWGREYGYYLRSRTP